MSVQFSDLSKAVSADGVISSEELTSLRQLGWGDGKIYHEEAEALFAINRTLNAPSSEWTDFFVDALTDFVLNGTEPRGYCDDTEAAWLIGALDHDGRLETVAELELLARIVECATNLPEPLKTYTLGQIEEVVLTGTGPTRSGKLSDTQINKTECNLLRRVVFASGGFCTAAVSRFDAEMLFRLKDATLNQDNAPEWQQLFVDGVANHLRGFNSPKAQLSHGRAKELEAFIADDSVNVGRFLTKVAKEAPQVHNHFGKVFGKKVAPSTFTEREAAGNVVTEDENNWLDGMIAADEEMDALEQALLAEIAKDLH